jgi:hydrogenase-4 component E
VNGQATGLAYDVAHLLGALVLLLSFALVAQRRLFGTITVIAMQAFCLAMLAAWQAYIQDAPQLFITAVITLLVKTVAVPIALHTTVVRLGIHRAIETALPIGLTLLLGLGLVVLSILLVLPVTANAAALTRETLAIALSVVLLGLLTMISRRNAVTQVVGFMSLENGLILAAVSAQGMPFVVEISGAFAVLIGVIVFGLFFFRIRERFDTLDVQFVERFRGERQ